MDFSIRPMNSSDLVDTLIWRNDPEVRSTALTNDTISAREHEAMFLYNNSVKLIFDVDYKPVGYIQINVDPDTAKGEWSFHMNPEYKGKGLSTIMLSSALYYLKDDYKELEARVKVDNKISIHLHEKLGFKCLYELNRIYHFSKKL